MTSRARKGPLLDPRQRGRVGQDQPRRGGAFSVIAHGYLRATKDSDLLVPDGPDADAVVLRFLQRGKLPTEPIPGLDED